MQVVLMFPLVAMVTFVIIPLMRAVFTTVISIAIDKIGISKQITAIGTMAKVGTIGAIIAV
jgi:hypothetical protein